MTILHLQANARCKDVVATVEASGGVIIERERERERESGLIRIHGPARGRTSPVDRKDSNQHR